MLQKPLSPAEFTRGILSDYLPIEIIRPEKPVKDMTVIISAEDIYGVVHTHEHQISSTSEGPLYYPGVKAIRQA
jgi:hypothetical protein